MKSYIQTYDSDVLVATIPLMPFTTLTISEYVRIQALLNLQTNQLWDRYVSGDLTLSVSERLNINVAGSEWLG